MIRPEARGLAELREARSESRNLFILVAVFSFFVNMLMLSPSLFMLQVYDRVLGSRSEATLVALAEWLPTVQRKGLALAPATAVLRKRNGWD